jgi:hypothetical protein
MSFSNYFEDASIEPSWADCTTYSSSAFPAARFLLPRPHTLADASAPSNTDICLFDPLEDSSVPSSRRASDDSLETQGVPKRRYALTLVDAVPVGTSNLSAETT